MELRSLHYFVRVAELGSITRAAAHLHLAQPALTRHVQRLEEELGVALFTRANRGVRLTEAGEKLLDSAVRILRDIERTGDEIRTQDAHPSGRIILGITPTLCPVLVPELRVPLNWAVGPYFQAPSITFERAGAGPCAYARSCACAAPLAAGHGGGGCRGSNRGPSAV